MGRVAGGQEHEHLLVIGDARKIARLARRGGEPRVSRNGGCAGIRSGRRWRSHAP
jgi:hypothetical protein